MTRDEVSALSVLIGEFRDFRKEDAVWKGKQDERLRNVEAFVTSEQAEDERESARGVSRRSYIASAIAAVGVTVSIALGVINFLS